MSHRAVKALVVIMPGNYQEFLRMLRREPGRPTLFEPYPTQKITSQLLWRNGAHLWDSFPHRVLTWIQLYDYLCADTVILHVDRDEMETLSDLHAALPDSLRFTVIAEDPCALALADQNDTVCALASHLPLDGRDFQKPLIAMADRDEEIEAAILHRCSGVHIPRHSEALWKQYGSHIALLGGLGVEFLNQDNPVAIHQRVRALHALTNGAGYSLGSGVDGDAEVSYLGFISMLGMYHQLCNDASTPIGKN